ncbi:hypothetical protein EJ04DRAFT_509034 [Polyplosphaeria fusca]|uniref:Uncharacterized protein n=1 Tax=Polyplosphaeria fusca TaxID=682080 RepID=A0A9P4R9F7_9PLEO|nr:hypothetical protein EJ04DRAFT_509034 [Polyplosphaeria fusca]
MLLTNIVLTAGLAAAAPSRCGRNTLTEAAIQAIAPSTASCAGAEFSNECATAADAVGPIQASFQKYGVTSTAEQAALIALMLYESGNFQYNIHHFPSPNPGQGTRNMQNYPFNLQYATALFGAQAQEKAAQGPDAVLGMLLGNDESFGSAAWFLTSQCNAQIRQGLHSGSQAGWSAYLTQCIGTTDTPDRDAVWTKAMQVLQSAA